ncbi:MAG TPA: hypothetical protein VHD36_05010 [Pirellulales bacterium]|nr:hypothetical protein [Pirellulales bacterium]
MKAQGVSWLRSLKLSETIRVDVPSSPEAVAECLRSHVQKPSWRGSLLAALAPAAAGPFCTFQGQVALSGFDLCLVLPVSGSFSVPRINVRGVIESTSAGACVTATIEPARSAGGFVVALAIGLLTLFCVASAFIGAYRVLLYLAGALALLAVYSAAVHGVYRTLFLHEAEEIHRQLTFALSHKRGDL